MEMPPQVYRLLDRIKKSEICQCPCTCVSCGKLRKYVNDVEKYYAEEKEKEERKHG